MTQVGERTRNNNAPNGPTLTGDTFASLVAIAVVGGSLALHGLVVGRTMGETALGHAGLALAVGLGLPQIAGAGLVPAMTRFTAARRAAGDGRGARRSAFGGLVVLVGIGAGFAGLAFITRASWAPRIGLPLTEVAPALVLVVMEAAYLGMKAILYGLGRARRYARIETLAGLAFVSTLSVLVVAPRGITLPLIAPFLAADGVFVLLAALALLGRSQNSHGIGLRNDVSVATTRPRGPSMAGFAALASIGTGASLARLRMVPIALGLAYGAHEVGLLQAALVFFGPVLLVPRAVELALFPTLAGAHGRGDVHRFAQQAATSARVIAFGLALIAGGLIVAGPFVLGLILGPAFQTAAAPLALVVVAAWMLGLAVPAIVALSGADGIAIVNVAGVLGLMASVIVWLLLVPPLGALGAAAGLAVGSVPTALVPIRAAALRYGVAWRPAARTTAIAAALIVVFAWMARDGSSWAIVALAAYMVAIVFLESDLLRRFVGAGA